MLLCDLELNRFREILSDEYDLEFVQLCSDASITKNGCAWRVTNLDGAELFESPRYIGGSCNIAEFLGIVTALQMIPKKGIVWTDSLIAMDWVRSKRCRSWSLNNSELIWLVERAEEWLEHNTHAHVRYWNKYKRGEIPADFGLK